MTPEEAKPRTMLVVNKAHHQPNYEVQGFTAKETAEIAKAYGHACVHAYLDSAADTIAKFDQLFDGWSK